jgi:Skp family chaperone for outer membrane proteins
VSWFGQSEQDKQQQVNIEDILKPLHYAMSKMNFHLSDLYAKYDTNKDDMLSSDELNQACKEMLHYDLTREEVLIFK